MPRKFKSHSKYSKSGRSNFLMGQSSSSNPACLKYRSEAHNDRKTISIATTSVDESILRANDGDKSLPPIFSMNSMQIGAPGYIKSSVDNESMVSDGLTLRSLFSGCTNPSFDSVYRMERSNSRLHSETLATLAAVNQMIKENNGSENDASYYVSFLSILHKTGFDEPDRVEVLAFLLSLILKNSNKDFVRHSYKNAVEIIHRKIMQYKHHKHDGPVKSLLIVFGLICNCLPVSMWHEDNTKSVLADIADFCTHELAGVRTSTRRIIRSIVNNPTSWTNEGIHPAAGSLGSYISTRLEDCAAKFDSTALPTHIFCFLEGIMDHMPSHIFKRLVRCILKFLTFDNRTVKCSAFRCLYQTMQKQPRDSVLPVDVNVRIISDMQNLFPLSGDISLVAYWMQAACESHICLTLKDARKSIDLLPQTLLMFIQTFSRENDSLSEVSSNHIIRIIQYCAKSDSSTVNFCTNLLSECLIPVNALVFRSVLKTIEKIFELCGKLIDKQLLKKSLEVLAEIRENHSWSLDGAVDSTVGAAVKHIGLIAILQSLPLNLDVNSASIEFKRSWLLPIIQANIRGESLSIFNHLFLPLSMKFFEVSRTNSSIQSKLFTVILHQLWELLPSFLSSCPDFVVSFPQLAPIMGAALNERPDLRLVVLKSLRCALIFAKEEDPSSCRRELMGKYSKNFLPILFNLYTSVGNHSALNNQFDYDSNAVHLAILETISMYVPVAPADLMHSYINSAIEKMLEMEIPSNSDKAYILDLIKVFIGRCEISDFERIFPIIRCSIDNQEIGLKKKAFRILEQMYCRYGNENFQSFFQAFESDLTQIIFQDMQNIAFNARSSVVNVYKTIASFINSLSEMNSYISRIFNGLILCFDKANNMRTRRLTAQCFHYICYRLTDLGKNHGCTKSMVLSRVFELVYGIIGCDNHVSASSSVPLEKARPAFVVLNIMVQKYPDIFEGSSLNRLIVVTSNWIGDGRSRVRILVIRLLRILCSKLPDYALFMYQDILFQSIFVRQMTADVTHKVRKANRLLLEVLADRFGVEILEKSTSKLDWLKQLKVIKKAKRRYKREPTNIDRFMSRERLEESVSTAFTAGADTILNDRLHHNDCYIEDNGKLYESAKSGILLNESDEEDDLTDLLTMTSDKRFGRCHNRCARKSISSQKGFLQAEDGRFLIEDLDARQKGLKKLSSNREVFEVDLKGKKMVEIDTDDENKSSDADAIGSSKWNVSDRGIHRKILYVAEGKNPSLRTKNLSKSKHKKRVGGDIKKKGAKYEPYAYIPLKSVEDRKHSHRIM